MRSRQLHACGRPWRRHGRALALPPVTAWHGYHGTDLQASLRPPQSLRATSAALAAPISPRGVAAHGRRDSGSGDGASRTNRWWQTVAAMALVTAWATAPRRGGGVRRNGGRWPSKEPASTPAAAVIQAERKRRVRGRRRHRRRRRRGRRSAAMAASSARSAADPGTRVANAGSEHRQSERLQCSV